MGDAETVSNEKIVARLNELLTEVDLETTTERTLRKRLEQELGVDLSDKKQIIRQEVDKYLAAQQVQHEEEEEEEEEDEEEEEEEPRRGKRKASSSGVANNLLSPELSAFVGAESMKRTEIVKLLWEHIKSNGLQDPSNKRNILLDEKLSTLFTTPLDAFSMNKQLSQHITKTEPPKKAKVSSSAGGGGKGGGGFTKAIRVSERLEQWVGKPDISRPEFTKFFWNYVKDNALQDPSNKKYILCDETLQQFTGTKRISGFGFQKYFQKDFLRDDE